jgi:hypothetical protein
VAKLEGCSCRGDRGTEFRSGAMVASRLQKVCGRVSYGRVALFYPVSSLDRRGVVGKGKGKFLCGESQDGSGTRKQEEEKTVKGRSTKGMREISSKS